MITLFAFHLLFADAMAGGREVPEVLSRAFEQRMAFKTARLDYERHVRAIESGADITMRYEARFSPNRIYCTSLGDEDGVRARNPLTGEPVFGVLNACLPRRYLRCLDSGEEWIRDEAQPSARIVEPHSSPGRREFVDPRSTGLFIKNIGDKSPSEYLQELQKANAKWSQRERDGCIEVCLIDGTERGEHAEFVWRIDPSKDNAVVEVCGYAVDSDGKRERVDRTTNEYELVDQHWSLKKTVYESLGKQINESVIVTHAEYNRKSHQKTIDADILELPFGAEVADFRERPLARQPKRYLLAGELISKDQWEAMKTPADEDVLRQFRNAVAELGLGRYPSWWGSNDANLGLDFVSTTPDLWEAYVRRWILRHTETLIVDRMAVAAPTNLSRAQIEAAWSILKDCHKRAEPIVRRMQRELKKDEDVVLKAGETSQPAGAAGKRGETTASGSAPRTRSDTRSHLYDREFELIFQSLRERLEKLLRSAQVDTTIGAAGDGD